MIVSAHQPHYLPWIGYFNKIHLSDGFMIMDNMEYTNKGYINRNRILTKRGIIYLSVPIRKVKGFKSKINELEIDWSNNKKWNEKHLKSIAHSYSKSKGYKTFFPILENLLLNDRPKLLIELQTCIIKQILAYLEIDTKIMFASETNTSGKKETELITEICRTGLCSSFLLGLGASTKYVDRVFVEKAGYNLKYQQFEHPNYTQLRPGFIKGLSVLDLIFSTDQSEAIYHVKQSGRIK